MWNSDNFPLKHSVLHLHDSSYVHELMALAQALIDLEAKAGRFFKIPSLDDDVVKRLLESVEASGGLPVTIDYREKILAVSYTDLTEVILPLCSWLEGLVKVHAEKEGGECRGSGISMVRELFMPFPCYHA